MSPTPLWLRVALAVVFGLFYAYDVWEAIGNLVGVAQLAGRLDSALTAGGWIILIVAVLLPVALFAAVFALGRRRGPLLQAALYLIGLAVSAVWSLDLLAGVPAITLIS